MRIALVDRWSDERRQQETWGWRTLGEVCAVNQTIAINVISIGASHDKRRHSPWTKCHRHGNIFRFQRKGTSEGFAGTWKPDWRENAGIPTEKWLTKMREDGCMADLVRGIEVPVPRSRDAYLEEMYRIAREMSRPVGGFPAMRLAGCFGYSPCAFRCTCHGGTTPEDARFVRRIESVPLTPLDAVAQ